MGLNTFLFFNGAAERLLGKSAYYHALRLDLLGASLRRAELWPPIAPWQSYEAPFNPHTANYYIFFSC